jgi:hypothetical protein
MRTRHALVTLALLAALAAPASAAASVDLGIGADAIQGWSGELNLTLGAETWLARKLTVGGRAGVALFSNGNSLGVPVDVFLKLHVQRIYFQGLVGPWFIFDSGDLFHFHGAFGFGLETRGADFGLEVGGLGGATIVGLRLAFKI